MVVLQWINEEGLKRESASLPVPSKISASNTTAVSAYGLDEYERSSYYYGIAGETDHPDLLYRSDFDTTLFPRTHPVKSIRGVFNTPLNNVWSTVGPHICDLVKARKVNWSALDVVRFFTEGEEGKGSLGPVVIWVGVIPASTSADTAHEVSREILTLLRENGVDDVVVEWRESVLQRLDCLSLEEQKEWATKKKKGKRKRRTRQ